MATYQPSTWSPRPLAHLHYGPASVSTHLVSSLPTPESRAFIVTGNSLATKTPLVAQVEQLLGPAHHAGTFSRIGAHAPVAALDDAFTLLQSSGTVDVVISIGGGSPIDSAKILSSRTHEKTGRWLTHIAIPTTLGAAECTAIGGFTGADGLKTGAAAPELAVTTIIYDPAFAAHTPMKLWLATGVRALDHALETLYKPDAAEVPCKVMALRAAGELYECLPRAKAEGEFPRDRELTTRLFLAAYSSLGFLGSPVKGGLGLSHALGYALGSPYGIPHGETSCITLGKVVQLKARMSKDAAAQVARALPAFGGQSKGDALEDALEVGEKVRALVRKLGLEQNLNDRGVGRDQVDLIVQRATKEKSGPLFDEVKSLVEGLYG